MRCREGLGVRPGVGREEGPEEREGPLLPFSVQFLEDFAFAAALGGGSVYLYLEILGFRSSLYRL